MNRYKAVASSGLVLSVMLSVVGCTPQGTISEETSLCDGIVMMCYGNTTSMINYSSEV